MTEVTSNSNPSTGRYQSMWGDDFYHISQQTNKNPSLSGFNPCDSIAWDEVEYITFENDENYEEDENKCLSFVADSLKLHKIMAVNYEIKCFDVTTE